MREIKFRVWCKENEQFIQFNKMGFLEDGSLWYVQEVDENEPPYFENQNNWELMQYTGLKDKNGIEIYEGDIVKTIKGNVQVVEFLTAYNSKDNKTMVSQFGLKGDKGYYFFDVTDEVIGNICENPELLETKKSS